MVMNIKKYLLLCSLYLASALSASPNPSEGESVFLPHLSVNADLLYWVPQVSGLDGNFGSGSSQITTSGGKTTTISQEHDVDPSLHWSPGYRVGLAWICNNSWTLGGIWTDFHGSGNKASNNGKWNVRLYQIDLAALYNVSLSSVHLQPFIGLRGASIRQKLDAEVITQVIYASGTATDTRTFQDHQQFYGLGPLFGLNTNYAVQYGISFYGNLGLGLFYGNYRLQFNDSESVTAPATPAQIQSTIHKNMKAFDFNVDLALGIQWEYLIGNACNLIVKLGLENHQYFNQSRLGYTFGNLSFSGGIFSFGLAF